jgi:hypothetical protein
MWRENVIVSYVNAWYKALVRGYLDGFMAQGPWEECCIVKKKILSENQRKSKNQKNQTTLYFDD